MVGKKKKKKRFRISPPARVVSGDCLNRGLRLRITAANLRNIPVVSRDWFCSLCDHSPLRHIFVHARKFDKLPVPPRGECDIGLDFSELAKPNFKCSCSCEWRFHEQYCAWKCVLLISRIVFPCARDFECGTAITLWNQTAMHPPV